MKNLKEYEKLTYLPNSHILHRFYPKCNDGAWQKWMKDLFCLLPLEMGSSNLGANCLPLADNALLNKCTLAHILSSSARWAVMVFIDDTQEIPVAAKPPTVVAITIYVFGNKTIMELSTSLKHNKFILQIHDPSLCLGSHI